jgi:hypothetical protein
MLHAGPQGFVTHLHAYQDAINRADADAAATLFLDTARIEEEGIPYPSVRAVLDYLVGERAHLELSDFRIQGQQVTGKGQDTHAVHPRALLETKLYGIKEFAVIDPSGVRLIFAEPIPEEERSGIG